MAKKVEALAHLIGRRCIMTRRGNAGGLEGDDTVSGIVSDVSEDGVLFIIDGGGVPLVPHSEIRSLKASPGAGK